MGGKGHRLNTGRCICRAAYWLKHFVHNLVPALNAGRMAYLVGRPTPHAGPSPSSRCATIDDMFTINVHAGASMPSPTESADADEDELEDDVELREAGAGA